MHLHVAKFWWQCSYYGVKITKELATCILTGIITDTGGFQWGGVTPETFEFAAELVRKGAKLKEICRIALRKKSKAHCELEKIIYDRLEFLEDGKKVKITDRFRGRELNYVKLGEDNLNKFIEALEDVSTPEKKAVLEGKNMFIILAKKAN